MLRSFVLADLITLGNAACGSLSIFLCLRHVAEGSRGALWLAIGLLPVALVCDITDGMVARWRRKQSAMGADLDSLADIVSFGVAPAVIGHTLGMRGGWDLLILVYFVGCGISRLARYNVTAAMLSDESGKVTHYEGAPIPTSLALVAVLAVAFASGDVGPHLWLGSVELAGLVWHPLSLLYAASGTAMMSATLKIPKP